MAYFSALLLHLRLIRDGLLWQTGARPLDLYLRGDLIQLQLVADLLRATRNPCSYRSSNSNGLGRTTWISNRESHAAHYMDKRASAVMMAYLILCKPLEELFADYLQDRDELITSEAIDPNSLTEEEQDELEADAMEDEDSIEPNTVGSVDDQHDDLRAAKRVAQEGTYELLFNIAPMQLEKQLRPGQVYRTIQAVTKRFLGTSITVSAWRHMSVAWLRTLVLHHTPEPSLGALNVAHSQSQHAGRTARNVYGRTQLDHKFVSSEAQYGHQFVSEEWHKLMKLVDAEDQIQAKTVNGQTCVQQVVHKQVVIQSSRVRNASTQVQETVGTQTDLEVEACGDKDVDDELVDMLKATALTHLSKRCLRTNFVLVLARRCPAVLNATVPLRAGLDAEMTKKELVEPLTSLWLALVEVELSLFDNDKVHFVNVFLLCTAMSKGSGILQDIRQWTTTPAGLLQRMSMARTASVAEGQAGVDVEVRADGDVTDETLRTIVCRGIELNVEELGAALEQMRKDMTETLDKHLLLDSRLRKDYEKEYERLRLKEDRTNRVKNWWVGHGSPAENALFDHIGQTLSLRQEFIQTEHGPSGELTFREDRVRVWLLYVCRFNELALTYTHIAGGLPPRASVYQGLSYKNGVGRQRAAFFAEKQLSILTRVSKTYWLSLNEQHTFRYMDQEISTLIFMYLLLCKPLEHMLSSWLQKRGGLKTPDDENGIHNAEQDDEDLLDDELDEDHMSHDETMTLRREVRDARNHYNNSHLLFNIAPLQTMVSPATIYAAFRRQMTTYLHRPKLGVATWRHAATFWMTTFVINRLSAETTRALGSLIHTQAQHSGDTAQRAYARTASDHVQTKMSSRLMHQVASQKWHALFGLDRKRSIAELTANQEALEARYPISWNPVTDLSSEANGRIIMNTRAEHDVPYMTQLAKQASISWGHSFNSQEQLDLAAAIDQHRPEDEWLIVVAPTGMGKNILYPAQAGLSPACRYGAVDCAVADGLDVLIVTTDMFVRVGSESLHGKVCFQRIRTVVMDEAHTLISDASYRDVMDEVAASVGSGGWTNIKRVALTGTLCIGDQEHLFRKLGQQVGGKVYRLETMRRDLQLRVLHGNQPNFLSHVQAIVDTQRMMRQANGERVHMMVFCDTVNEQEARGSVQTNVGRGREHATASRAVSSTANPHETRANPVGLDHLRASTIGLGFNLVSGAIGCKLSLGYTAAPAPSTSKRTASDVTCTAAASSTAAQAAESHLPAAKRAASSDARTATVAATATTCSEATVSAAATPSNRHNVAPIFRPKSGTEKKYLMNYAAADKFIGVLKLMDDYCMRCTIRQAKPVLKAEHQCVSNRGCKRCHFGGHETSECFVGFAYPKWTCCYACGMPKGIRGWDTRNHRCGQSQGLDSGLSCLLLYSDCHSGLRDLAKRMGYNLRVQTLKDLKTRDLFVKWLYSPVPGLPPGDGHWRLVEFVFESARILLRSAAKAQVGPDSFR
ncbi:uncharacterized protein MONBRDRAFT_13131 [Monosiga brevicollis MX1]|uniref:Helicase ATP-binding domain-containing protein n=1 Tax=Monosiga brevicollis TaxID=81824 RepID=A9VED5_MONBE|nr:uncharacterized protein MONBRDRAFT_13131 [Monosiga brevicollis MX1]EDQ84106.1 predicted protein [Monosiga brevicollis MX1]|eukprot:XP_001751082.1 hypothetical protein [Monosiga brevicollis MX1]